MNKYHLAELPFPGDSTILFDKIVDWSWPIFLDSCQPQGEQGRYDIMSAKPYKTFTTYGTLTTITTGALQQITQQEPLQLIKQHLLTTGFQTIPFLPFAGGALGYYSYDLAQHIAGLPIHTRATNRHIEMPDLAIGLYDWGIVVDHQQRCCWCFAQTTLPTASWQQLLKHLQISSAPSVIPSSTPLQLLEPLQSNMTQAAYQQAFAKIQAHIRQGECYQVNLAQCFSTRVTGNSWHSYQLLRLSNPAPYAAFMRFPNSSILSLSPEQFLGVRGNQVQTKPIKGTRPRNSDPNTDALLATQLLASEKDRAENLMIVDLLRNDLGKSCVPGSIQVPQLFALESFAAVHHLVSTITGHLLPGQHSLDLLRDCFPGGSITGAPKKRAMEIIAALEPQPRSLYCGAIGYIDHTGNMDINIAIRTLIICQGKLYCYAGSGLVADSTAEEEYAETFIKVSKIMQTLQA